MPNIWTQSGLKPKVIEAFLIRNEQVYFSWMYTILCDASAADDIVGINQNILSGI